jgi:excisionase family DNA binding protein
MELLTTEEAAAKLRLKPGTLENWRVQNIGPPYSKIGGKVRYDAEALAEWAQKDRRVG